MLLPQTINQYLENKIIYRSECGKKLILDFQELKQFDISMYEGLLDEPKKFLKFIKEPIKKLFNKYESDNLEFKNFSEENNISQLRVKHIEKLINVKGMVTKITKVIAKVEKCIWECHRCGTNITTINSNKPIMCSCGNKSGFSLKNKEMGDIQELELEELQDELDGKQPQKIRIRLEGNLTDDKFSGILQPGNKISILGVVEEIELPKKNQKQEETMFEYRVLTIGLESLDEKFNEEYISEEDKKTILEISQNNPLQQLTENLAPSIFGYEDIKKAIILQMVGGVKKKRVGGIYSRNRIHILLCGDPGLSKSVEKNSKIIYKGKKDSGYIKICELHKKISNGEDIKVLTIDKDKHSSMWCKVKDSSEHLPEKELIRIKTEHGKEIIGTKDHSFLTINNLGEIIKIKGDELNINNYLPLPINHHKKTISKVCLSKFNFRKKYSSNQKDIKEIILDSDFGFFVGIFLAEGNLSQSCITISSQNNSTKKIVSNFCKKYNIHFKIDEKKINLYSITLVRFLRDCCYNLNGFKNSKVKGNYSKIKKLPGFSFHSPIEFIYSLISGLFSGDGYLRKDKNYCDSLVLTSISEELIKDTSDLLFSIGVVNKMTKQKYTYKGELRDNFLLAIPSQYFRKIINKIRLFGKKMKPLRKGKIDYINILPIGDLLYNLCLKLKYNSRVNGDRSFCAMIRSIKNGYKRISRQRLKKILNKIKRDKKKLTQEYYTLMNISNSNIVWSRIKEIEVIKKEEYVYDLEIEKTNTFVANGIGVHNTFLVKNVAARMPKSYYISGDETTKAGLVAIVDRDSLTNAWSLKAGALSKANDSILIIDEMDKLNDEDRNALHTPMESGEIVINKADIHCYSEDTEVLTERGWNKYGDVGNLRIAQYNKEINMMEFVKHQGLSLFDYKGKMFHFKNKRNDILVTPNHRMLIRPSADNRGKYKVVRAENITHNRFNFINSAQINNRVEDKFFTLNGTILNINRKHKKYLEQTVDKKIPMDLWLEFLGYFLSEGGLSYEPINGNKKYYITLGQNIGENQKKIELCLKNLEKYGLKFCRIVEERKNKINHIRYSIGNKQLWDYLFKNCMYKNEKANKYHKYHKEIPKFAFNLGKHQIKILFDSMMLGDGYIKDRNPKSYSSTSEKLIDGFQIISLMLGFSAKKSKREGHKRNGYYENDIYTISLTKRNKPQFKLSQLEKINYIGKVFCFSVPSGIFFTRRNGVVAIQGNTTLRSDCSILGVANPKEGMFELTGDKTITQQINLPPPLMSRFDIIFVMTDKIDEQTDNSIVKAIYSQTKESLGISKELFRKYIVYVRKLKPKLLGENLEQISNFYHQIRKKSISPTSKMRGMPITPRHLEGIIRLSEASAKIRMSDYVEEEDIKLAQDIFLSSLLKLGMDEESGVFDMARMGHGRTLSKKNKARFILEIIQDFLEEHNLNAINDKILKDLCMNKGINKLEYHELVFELNKEGEILQSKDGWKLADQNI